MFGWKETKHITDFKISEIQIQLDDTQKLPYYQNDRLL